MINYDVLSVYSKELGFPNRLLNGLRVANIQTLGDLRKLKRSELNSIPGLGASSINTIKDALKKYYETDDPVLADINLRLKRIESMLEKLV